MKMLNNKFARTMSCAVVVAGAAAMLSVGAFAAEDDGTVVGYRPVQEHTAQGIITTYNTEDMAPISDDVTIAGYLPPQEQMVQGDIALHSGDQAVEKDPNYGGYGAPEGDAIQGDVMLISADDETEYTTPATADYTVKGLFGKQVLFTARQKGRVLTLSAPDDNAIFRSTVGEMQKLMDQGVSTLVLNTGKRSTTLNLTLLVEGQNENDRVVLRHLGSNATLTVGLRCRRDLLIGR